MATFSKLNPSNISAKSLSLRALTALMISMSLAAASCTKKRTAELPEDSQLNILPISTFLKPSEMSSMNIAGIQAQSSGSNSQVKALLTQSRQRITARDVTAPAEIQFMFEGLQLISPMQREFRVTFSIDRSHITGYKIVESAVDLTPFETNIAITAREAELVSNLSRAGENNVVSELVNQLSVERKKRVDILSKNRPGALLVPLFKYAISAYGIVERQKNELKEETSVLRLKPTEWNQATHIQIDAKSDARLVVGLLADQVKQLDQIYDLAKVDLKVSTLSELSDRLEINITNVLKRSDSRRANEVRVVTRLDGENLNIYEVTDLTALSKGERVSMELAAGASEHYIPCSDKIFSEILINADSSCVLALRATSKVKYVRAELAATDKNGATSPNVKVIEIDRAQDAKLIEVASESTTEDFKLGFELERELEQIYKLSDLDKKKLTVQQVKQFVGVTVDGLDMTAEVVTKADDKALHIYLISSVGKLSSGEKLKYELKNNGAQQIVNCAKSELFAVIGSNDDQCVIIRKAMIPLTFVKPELVAKKEEVIASYGIAILPVTKKESPGLVSIQADQKASAFPQDIQEERMLTQLFSLNDLEGQVTTVDELSKKQKIGLKFLNANTNVFLKLDDDGLYVYEITDISKLTENQLRLYKNNASQGQIMSCQDKFAGGKIQNPVANCVLVRVARVPVSYVKVETVLQDQSNLNSDQLLISRVQKTSADARVQILENSLAEQLEVTQTLDPDSTIKISDIQGEFFYRRTFEDASNMFLGRTGTSGDLSIVKFELEDDRLVVRNQESLIKYTGQGAKDREEIMSIPVKYYILKKENALGVPFVTPQLAESTKEKAEYLKLDWTDNRVPNASSPLAFFDGGDCFLANTSQKVTDMDMRLASDGLLNFSIAASYTMKPSLQCITVKDVNSAYWAGAYQFNYNVKERISFKRHSNPLDDQQFVANMSHMAQGAFNFGLFTFADRVTENGILPNRDGSEKYMPVVHDFRNNRTITYYLGGINTAATNPERKAMLKAAAQQVVDEWNQTFAYAFRGTPLDRADLKANPYIKLEFDDATTGRLGDLDRSYIWFNELDAENGLLGVAQPAANPRSGNVIAANAIVYTANTLDQARRLVDLTATARKYEKALERVRNEALTEAKQKIAAGKLKIGGVSTLKDPSTSGSNNEASATETAPSSGKKSKILSQVTVEQLENKIIQQALKLGIGNQAAEKLLANNSIPRLGTQPSRPLTKETFKNSGKGEKVKLEHNSSTFTKKLVELVLNKKLSQSPKELELAVNNAFISFGGLDEATKAKLQARSEQLAMAVRFDQNNLHRPGCFKYSRNEANDANLIFAKDAEGKILLDEMGNEIVDIEASVQENFKSGVMSTLSHELGHAFGLMHNFKGSIDAANYEFAGVSESEKTNRNYSSIMDYVPDSEMIYRGPGPYDAHAIRAGYTGYVELSAAILGNPQNLKNFEKQGIKLIENKFIHVNDMLKVLGLNSFVHVTKDSFNSRGFLKYYSQCNDMGQSETMLCAMFDSGSTAVEIVQNKVADYKRNYMNRYHVGDQIIFSFEQKVAAILRNIGTFQHIRSFLDESVRAIINGTGRPEAEAEAIRQDLAQSAKVGYQFFHELIRNPDADGVSAGFATLDERIQVIPFQYLGNIELDKDNELCEPNEQKQLVCTDMKVLEAKSLYDISRTRQKMDTLGIAYDKLFAMQFLMQSSSAPTSEDSEQSQISYLDFEQWFLGVKDPSESLTIRTLNELVTGDLQVGFFGPSRALQENPFFRAQEKAEVNRMIGEQAAIASTIGLWEAKWKGFDLFSESFKVSRSSVSRAPTDRFNVVKLGQSRKSSDSRVFYPTQNAVVSSAMIKTAARTEVLNENKESLYATMKLIVEAELPAKKLIDAQINASCEPGPTGDPKTPEICVAALGMTDEQWNQKIPEVAKARNQGEKLTNRLLKQIRDLNKSELLLSKDQDTSSSPINLAVQVQVMRNLITAQVPMISEVLERLKSVPAAELENEINAVIEMIRKVSAENAKLDSVPLISFTFQFMTDLVQDLKVDLQDGSPLTGAAVARVMMNGAKLKADYEKNLETIEKLSFYTGLIDPDTVSQ